MKKNLLIILILCIVSFSYGQNTPCTAINSAGTCSWVFPNLPVAGTWTAVGSGIVNPTCPNLTGNSNYWITYTIPAGTASLDFWFARPATGGSRIDDVGVQLYTASSCSGPFTLVNCYNDAGTDVNQSISVTPGTTYYFRIFDTDGSGGGANFDYRICPRPFGYNACGAIPITSFPYTHNGNNATGGFANVLSGSCNGNYSTSGLGNDVFYQVTVGANSYLSIQLTNTTAAGMAEVAVLSASSCSGPFTCVTNGAWGGGLQTTTGPGSTTNGPNSPCRTVYFQNAGTYYLQVDGMSNSNGPYTLSVNSFTPPVGDNCATPSTVTAGSPITINSTNCNYTAGTDDPAGALICAGTIENTNWVAFQSDGSGTAVNVSVNSVTCSTGYYTGSGFYAGSGQFGVITGTCGGPYSGVGGVPCASLSTGQTYSASLPNAVSTRYYFVWDGNGGAECQYTISVTNTIPLPIELLYFNIEEADLNAVKLIWATSSEKNNEFFTIERSADGINFYPIGTVYGAGNSTSELTYRFIDNEPLSGLSYYQLKQTDTDGKETYSMVVSNLLNTTENHTFRIQPNPASSNEILHIDITSKKEDKILLQIADATGKQLLSEIIDVKKSVSVAFDNKLPSGVYFITTRNSTGETLTKKLIIN